MNKKLLTIILVLFFCFNLSSFAEIEKSAIEIIQVNPYFYQGNVNIDITASNNGTTDGNIFMEFVFNKEKKTESHVIPASEIRKFTYTLQNPQEGTLEVYVLSDENRSCLVNLDPANELLDFECIKDDLRKTKKIEKPDFMEKYFGKQWPYLFVGLIVLFIVAFLAYKYFSREKTQLEKDLESGRKLLKGINDLEKWKKEGKKEEKGILRFLKKDKSSEDKKPNEKD